MSHEDAMRFIHMGIEIQEMQRRLCADIEKHDRLAAQEPHIYLAIYQRRVDLLRSIETFRAHQKMYMPSTYRLLHPNDRPLWHGYANSPQDTLLFLPSEIVPTDQREQSCIPGLPQIELLLRQEELLSGADVAWEQGAWSGAAFFG
ncbi:hypothetical protein B0H13DRAFT_2328585 [Mycena leptocephala]|nr:hypothetical protein B0H13DRAFT_2328585 [Mycena leptocephala]